MESSILKSTKKNLGVSSEDDSFDQDILTHINSAFSNLTQLGIGPDEGFRIEDDETEWEDFLGDEIRTDSAKTYVYLYVRQVFDPPTTSYLIAAFAKQMEQLEWRLNVHREGDGWVDPIPPVVIVDE